VYWVVLVRGPIDSEPNVGTLPLQPLEATQALACTVDQVSTVLSPLATVVAAAVRRMVGNSCCTRTCAAAELLPVGPVQLTEKTVVSLMLAISILPFVGCGPVMPPVPTQAVAFSECNRSDVPEPAGTTLASGVSETTGPEGVPDWQADRITRSSDPSAALVPAAEKTDIWGRLIRI
jgi:hypothetical protein